MRLRSFEEKYVAEKRVLLHFRRKNESLEGFLVRETRNSYFLVKAKLVTEKTAVDLQGTQIIPKADVFFVQVLEESYAL